MQLMKEMLDLRMEPWDTTQQIQRPESKKFIEVLHSTTSGTAVSKQDLRAQTTQKEKRRQILLSNTSNDLNNNNSRNTMTPLIAPASNNPLAIRSYVGLCELNGQGGLGDSASLINYERVFYKNNKRRLSIPKTFLPPS